MNDIVKRFTEVARARLVVTGEMANDTMTLFVEVANPAEEMVARISETIRDVTKLRGQVNVVPLGSLPNDGKIIEDAKSYK